MESNENIHTEFARMLGRDAKEAQLGQKGHVFWFYGLSGSGKSTLANGIERSLVDQGRFVKLLDGDNIRSALNQDLGFSDLDRAENIRRISEVSRLFLDAGYIVLTSFICPKQAYRNQAKALIGADDFTAIYAQASFEACAKRDVKGLYQKANSGTVKNFTGLDSSFEPPEATAQDWIINTELSSEAESVDSLVTKILPIVCNNH
tara:strand:- start:424 stop:1038 length:615 start_codon:yes stop_codon:yes gene_type:complete